MKVGDLVKRKDYRLPTVSRALGVIIEVESHALKDRNGAVEFWWRVLFNNYPSWVREEDLEVVSESR